jgi:2-desacetyl-2-hydroxyethyl bacteriochlorophyllide A dehydrogenase
MNTLVCTSPNQFNYVEIEKPVLQKNHAILQVKRIGICGTDLHAYNGTQPYFNYPRILGHELAGVIEEIDCNDNSFSVGDAVSIMPYFSCGTCIACKTNKPNCCANIQVFGVHIDGGMQEYIQVPVPYLLKANLSFDQLALIEPLSIGAHAINRAQLIKDESVLIIGAGPIGLGIIVLAKTITDKVIVVDTNNYRLQFCKNHFGVEHVLNPRETNLQQAIANITSNNMAQVIIDATGNKKAIDNAFTLLAHAGRFIIVGIQKENIEFSHPEFHKREATLMSSRNALKEDFEWVIKLLEQEIIQSEIFITQRIRFNKVADFFSQLCNPETAVIKAMIEL